MISFAQTISFANFFLLSFFFCFSFWAVIDLGVMFSSVICGSKGYLISGQRLLLFVSVYHSVSSMVARWRNWWEIRASQ
jgi:hypothetical protein